MLLTSLILLDLEIDQPSFSGSVNGLSSYISYPVPIPLESTLDLSFRITPTTASQISLLAFLGQSGVHDDKSDHLAVSFIQGYIMLTWNLGSGPRRIFTQKPLTFHDGEDEVISYHVQVVRQGRKASLYIDGKLNVTGNSPGDVARLDVVPTLYIGGHSLTNFTTLPHDLPLHSGFQGCIYDLQLKSGSLVVPLHETKGIIGRSVGQCGTRECHRSACHNNGACLQHGATYTCICPDGWFGTLCSQKMNPCNTENNKCGTDSTCVPLINGYECDCPIGKMGKYCETPVKYLSDVSLSGKRSYFTLNWPNHTHMAIPKDRYRQPLRTHDVDVFGYDSSKLMARNIIEHQRKAQLFSMEFQLRPLSETGLLMFLGNVYDHEEGFISLSLKGGVIEFRIAGQQGQLSIVRSNRILAIGEWHKIRLSQNGRRLSLWVEGSSSSNLLQPNTIFYHNYNTPIYIGGLPDLSKLPYNSVPGFPVPFKGCVRQFYLNSHRYVLNEQTIVETRNIQDCDGTACGGDSCDLGGHCYLDDKSNPHCKCPETSKGVHCEIPESCEIIKCKNNGKCMTNGECSCPNGWGGYFCEIATNRFSLPSFNGKSYMIIPSQRLTHKDKRNGLSSQYSNRLKFLQISVNFSTINMDGLLLWNDKNNEYLGVGLENGFLKVVSNLLSLKDEIIDVPTGGYLTDGGWHNIKLEIDEKGQTSLSVDDKLVYNEVHNSEKIGDLDQLGESFFLGKLKKLLNQRII
jgi:protein eyes shut